MEESTMENKFNLNRFGKYFLYDLKSRWSNLGLFLLIFALFPFILYLIHMIFATIAGGGLTELLYGGSINGPSLPARFVTFTIVTCIFMIMFPARAYGFITEKKAGSDWLMLPASRSEKFLSMMIISLIVIPVVYLVLYFLSDWVICLLDKSCGDAMAMTNVNGLDEDSPIHLVGNGIPLLLAGLAETVAVFLLGSLLFKKWKTGYTIIALFAINTALSIIFSVIITQFDMHSFGTFIINKLKDNAVHLDQIINIWINAGLILFVG
jgi:hypothetical protein